jgi:hypothetical protein
MVSSAAREDAGEKRRREHAAAADTRDKSNKPAGGKARAFPGGLHGIIENIVLLGLLNYLSMPLSL